MGLFFTFIESLCDSVSWVKNSFSRSEKNSFFRAVELQAGCGLAVRGDNHGERADDKKPRQLATDVDRFDGFDRSLDGPMGDGRPPQTPPPGLEPASTRSNQVLRTALQAGLQN